MKGIITVVVSLLISVVAQSSPVLADSYDGVGASWTKDRPLIDRQSSSVQSLDEVVSFLPPLARVESAEIRFRDFQPTSKEAEVSLVLGIPYGCFRAEVQIEHRDAHTHVLTPHLVPGDKTCLPLSRQETIDVRFGRLLAGEHVVSVADVVRPSEPARLFVIDGEAMASH